MRDGGERSIVRMETAGIRVDPEQLKKLSAYMEVEIARLTGEIRLTPQVHTDHEVILDQKGRHSWRPLAPRARVELNFTSPDLKWSGDGYFDTNSGTEPLERAFKTWHWGRAHRGNDLMLFYDVDHRHGAHTTLALKVEANGHVTEVATLPTQALPDTFWHIDRKAWTDDTSLVKVIKILEDTPFYARSALKAQLDQEHVTMMHESLNLDRLKNPIVRAMLPFRMPRRA